MKYAAFIFSFLLILYFFNSAFALPEVLNTTTTSTSPPPGGLDFFKGIYNYLLTANPILLLILGIILIVASKFAHWVGIVLIIVAIVHLLVIFLR